MNSRRWLAGLAIAVLLVVGGWFGWRSWQSRQAAPAGPRAEIAVPESARPRPGGPEVVSVDAGLDGRLLAGATPMAERVAVVGLLNKRKHWPASSAFKTSTTWSSASVRPPSTAPCKARQGRQVNRACAPV